MTFAQFRASYQGDKKSLPDAYWEHMEKVKVSHFDLENHWFDREERPYEEWKVMEDGPGFVYFLRTVTGWYKLGRTRNWSRSKKVDEDPKGYRKNNYQGPSKPDRIFFVRPVRRMREAEKFLKQFLLNRPNSPYFLADGNEWLLKARTAAARFHQKRRRTPAGPRGKAGAKSASTKVSGPPSETT
jgi:hypothetical protein